MQSNPFSLYLYPHQREPLKTYRNNHREPKTKASTDPLEIYIHPRRVYSRCKHMEAQHMQVSVVQLYFPLAPPAPGAAIKWLLATRELRPRSSI